MAHLLAAQAGPAGLPLHMRVAVVPPLLPAQAAAQAETGHAQQRGQAAPPTRMSRNGAARPRTAPAVQRILYAGTGLDQVALHGVEADAQALGNLGLALALHAVGDEDGPAALGQAVQGGLQHGQRLAVHDGVGHIGRMAGRQLFMDCRLAQVAGMALAAAVRIQRHVLGHHGQIGRGVARHLGRIRGPGQVCGLGRGAARVFRQPQPGVVHQVARLLAAACAARGGTHQVGIGPVKAGKQSAGEGGGQIHGAGS